MGAEVNKVESLPSQVSQIHEIIHVKGLQQSLAYVQHSLNVSCLCYCAM